MPRVGCLLFFEQVIFDVNMNVLFVCSKNKWRSRTAETIFKDTPGANVRSAGTDEGARIKLNEKLLLWADLIFVMEKKHKQIIQDKFDFVLQDKKLMVLDIPDEYQYMDEDLILSLETAVNPYFEK
jgi:predicted protein tyrosine phosphatase